MAVNRIVNMNLLVPVGALLVVGSVVGLEINTHSQEVLAQAKENNSKQTLTDTTTTNQTTTPNVAPASTTTTSPETTTPVQTGGNVPVVAAPISQPVVQEVVPVVQAPVEVAAPAPAPVVAPAPAPVVAPPATNTTTAAS